MIQNDLDILEELKVYKPLNNKIRIGNNQDAGYIIINGYNYDFYISGGISDNVSFDNDFNRIYPDVDGVCIDASCARPLYLTQKFNYLDNFIGRNNNNSTYNFTTLNEFFEDKQDVFLKLDIEGYEWDWIMDFDNFDKVKQIVIECHGFFDRRVENEGWQSIGNYKYEVILEALRKINITHYLVHIHGNNMGGSFNLLDNQVYGNTKGYSELPVVAELTFIRKKDCEIIGYNDEDLPVNNLDFPNCHHEPEINLSFYPFTIKNV
jgi:hypothetical protein